MGIDLTMIQEVKYFRGVGEEFIGRKRTSKKAEEEQEVQNIKGITEQP